MKLKNPPYAKGFKYDLNMKGQWRIMLDKQVAPKNSKIC